MRVTRDTLISIINSKKAKNSEKTNMLNELSNQEVELYISGWSVNDWRPRDDFFQIEYYLEGEHGRLMIVLNEAEGLTENTSEFIDTLIAKEGANIRIMGKASNGGHAVTSMFSVSISNLSFV